MQLLKLNFTSWLRVAIFSLLAGLLSNNDDIIRRQQRLAVGKLDSAAYSAGPHLSCAKFKACLKRARAGLQ